MLQKCQKLYTRSLECSLGTPSLMTVSPGLLAHEAETDHSKGTDRYFKIRDIERIFSKAQGTGVRAEQMRGTYKQLGLVSQLLQFILSLCLNHLNL